MHVHTYKKLETRASDHLRQSMSIVLPAGNIWTAVPGSGLLYEQGHWAKGTQTPFPTTSEQNNHVYGAFSAYVRICNSAINTVHLLNASQNRWHHTVI